MTAEPLSDDILAAMRDRSQGIDCAREAYDSAEDVPRLLAEVDRLRAENARLAAQEPVSGPETPQGHPSEGTSVSGPHARSESGDRRWSLTINDDGTITAAFDANSHTAVPTRERDIADAARPANYREAAASLRALGHDTAADLLESAARDLEEGDTTE